MIMLMMMADTDPVWWNYRRRGGGEGRRQDSDIDNDCDNDHNYDNGRYESSIVEITDKK